MQSKLEQIKKYLDSEAGIIITTDGEKQKRTIVDNRFELIDKYVNLIGNKDEHFYSELVRLISIYIDKLYDIKIDSVPKIVFDINGELVPQNYDTLGTGNKAYLKMANHDLCEKLFNYVCEILQKNQEIKLDAETLTRLLNRNPKPFTLAVAVDDYLYRGFDFEKIAKIINENQLLKKSNISIDDIYQILIDTVQLDNEVVFVNLIKPEDFKTNNTKIIELLNVCNAKTFVKITDIILRHFDKNFDRLDIAKKRKSKGFHESLIINMLKSYVNENDCNFIHQLLNDVDISIDYNFYWGDYYGQTSLKELLAFSNSRVIIRDLLSKSENIQNCYWDGDRKIQLYRLYAKLGEYEKALVNFSERYNYAYDFTEDFTNGFNEEGYARGEFTYSDSLVAFVKNICNSLTNDNVDYAKKKDIINSILNNEKVKYVNIGKMLPIVQEILSDEDFKSLLSSLMERYNSGTLGFIVVEETGNGFYDHYTIRVASEEEIDSALADLNDKSKNSTLAKKLIPSK